MTRPGDTLRGVLFDKDGTLFDFQSTWASWTGWVIEGLSEGDGGVAQALAEAAGYDLERRLLKPGSVVIASTLPETAQALTAAMPVPRDPRRVEAFLVEAALQARQVEAVPLVPLFEGLRSRGLVLGVATNDAEAPAERHLRAAGIRGHLDFVVGYDSGHGAKPAPGQLLAFAASTGLAPEAVAMVGDSTHDLHAGRAAGMVTIGVISGLVPVEDLAPLADVLLPDIGAIPAWLDGEDVAAR